MATKPQFATKAAKFRKSAPQKTRRDSEEKKIDIEDQNIGGGFKSLEEIRDALPDFLKPEFLKDKQGNRPNSPNYDPTTLYIPPNEWKGFTPVQCQYWRLKQDNFEKIFFFKLGKFYELFASDAVLCQRILDLNWMGGAKKLHVGFPDRALDKYLAILVERGYKVAVIE